MSYFNLDTIKRFYVGSIKKNGISWQKLIFIIYTKLKRAEIHTAQN